MSFSEWRNRILVPIGLASGLAYVIMLFTIGLNVPAEARVGTLFYFLGWLLVGHGIPTPLMPLNIPYVAITLTLTFGLWWLLKNYLRFINPRRRDNLPQTAVIWLLALPLAATIVLAAGHLLMFLGENMVGSVPQIPIVLGNWVISSDILSDWTTNPASPLMDAVFVLILPAFIIYGVYTLLSGYGVEGFKTKGGK